MYGVAIETRPTTGPGSRYTPGGDEETWDYTLQSHREGKGKGREGREGRD